MTALLQDVSAPPSYSELTEGKDALPTYDQLFGVGRMRQEISQARQRSSNKGVFAVKFYNIFCGSVACMICSIVLAAIPVTMIVIGSIYLDRCPAEKLIPIWLIVFGIFGLIQTAVSILKRCSRCCKENDDEDIRRDYGRTTGICCESVLIIFLFVWIIIGSIWVFRFYSTFMENECFRNEDCLDCCHPVPYICSFVTIIVMYSIGAFFLLCFCFCFVCCAFAAGISGDANFV